MEFLLRARRTLKNWGFRHPVKIAGKRIGFAAPLWYNIAPGGFLAMGILSFLLLFVFILIYFFLVYPVAPCESIKRILIIIQIIFLGFNCNKFLIILIDDVIRDV